MLYDLSVPQFQKMLHNLSRLLDKAEKNAEVRKFDPEALLQSRLAPDQFNLMRQVQIACDTAKLGVSRLTGKDAPVHEDSEKTLPQLTPIKAFPTTLFIGKDGTIKSIHAGFAGPATGIHFTEFCAAFEKTISDLLKE